LNYGEAFCDFVFLHFVNWYIYSDPACSIKMDVHLFNWYFKERKLLQIQQLSIWGHQLSTWRHNCQHILP